MLWWVPPTSVTLVLRVEKSRSRHVHHTMETTQLVSTCILGKRWRETKYPPYALTASLGLDVASVDVLPPPEDPDEMKSNEQKVTRAD